MNLNFRKSLLVALEPGSRTDHGEGLSACIADPLWMLARQWQTGEFAFDNGASPVRVKATYQIARVKEVSVAGTTTALTKKPLETVVEEEFLPLDWRTRVQIGQYFERLVRDKLAQKQTGPADIEAVIEGYRKMQGFQFVLPEITVNLDSDTEQFVRFMQGRVVDGLSILNSSFDPASTVQNTLPGNPKLSAADLSAINAALWDWFRQMGIRKAPATAPGWRNEQLQYAFEMPIPAKGQAAPWAKLEAPAYRNGEIDWYSFKAKGVLLNNNKDKLNWEQEREVVTTPTRLSIGGSSMRWWAFEDASTDFGAMEILPTDLAKVHLMEYVMAYGDDWFGINFPVPLVDAQNSPHGTLVKINSLQVYHVFDKDPEDPAARPVVIPPVEWNPDPLNRWDMFSLSLTPDSVNVEKAEDVLRNVLYIPPPGGRREESAPLEELRWMRDEGANMVWGVEHLILGGKGRPISGFEAQQERLKRQLLQDKKQLSEALTLTRKRLQVPNLAQPQRQLLESREAVFSERLRRLETTPTPEPYGQHPRYRLATTVSANWIPFVPADAGRALGKNYVTYRLRRAQMLHNTDDNAATPIPALSYLLALDKNPLLWLEEAAIPRAGLRLQLTAQRQRGLDGKPYFWYGRKVLTGRGEGNSGLEFDCLIK